jgi:type II secretory pathway component PulJ
MNGSRRTGKTLLEAVVIISIMGLIIGMSATSLATLFRLKQQLTRDTEQAASLARLATRLRLDAHAASAVVVDESCGLTLPNGSAIQYSINAPSIVREVRRDGAVIHRDRFLLPQSAAAEFSREGESPSGLVRLSIRPIEVKTRKTEMPRTRTIEAVVGLSQGLAQMEKRP